MKEKRVTLTLRLSDTLTVVPAGPYIDAHPDCPDIITDTVENQIKRFLPYLRLGAVPKIPFTYGEFSVNNRPVRAIRRTNIVNPATGETATRIFVEALRQLNVWHKLCVESSALQG